MGALSDVRVEVLGPLRLLLDGRVVDVRGQKRRAVLALLGLAEGRVVPVSHLVDALWPAEVPDSGRQALHSHVFRLRGHLGPASDRLETRHDGYRLELGADGLDVARARALLATARATARHDPSGALAALWRAHALWRGPMLADLADISTIAAAVEGYAQLRRDVTDALIASAVAAGRADEVVGLAAESLAADPLREPVLLLSMRVLAATGRAAEALNTGREYRDRLAEEAGLDPSPALDELTRDIAAGRVGPWRAGGRAGEREAGMPRHQDLAPPDQVPARAEITGQPATRLFGRDAEVAELHRLLARERLVTVVGPGGVGKTRVALEVARHQAATMLRLAPVTQAAAIPHELAAALGLKVARREVLASCLAVLGDRPALLVIDNCEHLLDAVRGTVESILASCPRVTMLTTSREPLALAAEYLYRLAPLPLPRLDGDLTRLDEELTRVPSVAVFLDRAGRVRPTPRPTTADLRLVADIVRRLDGIPLAIELAAGRLSTFSLADLHQRLDRALDLLGGRPSGDSRHATLRDTVEWSYRLLSDDERRLFRFLSVFADGIDLAAAERLGTDLRLGTDPGSVLARLVDASMIEANFVGGTRYRMLETLRAFGLDRLAAAGEEEVAGRHLARWAVDLTAWVAAGLMTEREPEADAVLRRELPNLRAAWRPVRDQGLLDEAVAIVTSLFNAVTYRDLVEVRDWAEELAEDPAVVNHPRVSVVLGIAAEAAYHQGDYSRAERLACAGLARSTGTDSAGWGCMSVLSVVALAQGVHAKVVEYCRATAAARGRPGESLGIAALAVAYSGDTDEAWTLNQRGLADADSPTMRAWGAYVAGEIDTCAGRLEPAERQYLRAVDLARASGATFLVGVATVGLAAAHTRMGRFREALTGYREVVDYFARTGNWPHQWTALRNLADLLRVLGDPEPAAQLEAAADEAADAPAVDSRESASREPASRREPVTPGPDRTRILEVARRVIERHLARS